MKFNFATVSDNQSVFDINLHRREDIKVLRMEIYHHEGDFAHLSLDVLPNYDLGGNKYIWVSVEDDEIHPLFFGKLTNFPYANSNNVLRLEYIAQFPEWQSKRDELATSLMVLPYWDNVFIPEGNENNYDNILEARPDNWHYDRTTGDITISSIANGDNIIDLDGDIIEDSLNVNVVGNSIDKIYVKGIVHWQQQVNGGSSLKNDILKAFGGTVQTLSPRLQKNWPKEGTTIGDSGFKISSSKCQEIRRFVFPNGGNADRSNSFRYELNSDADKFVSSLYKEMQSKGVIDTSLPKYTYDTDIEVSFSYKQARKEIIDISIDVINQKIRDDNSAGEEYIVRNANDIIRNTYTSPQTSSYFLTERGHSSFRYLVELAKALAIKSSRTIEISFETSFVNAMNISCRDAIRIYSPKLPGNIVVGKVKSYKLIAGGDSSELKALITIGVMTGKINPGNISDAYDGYCEYGYSEYNYSVNLGVIYSGDDNINYLSYNDQIPFIPAAVNRLVNGDIIKKINVSNKLYDQEQFIQMHQHPNSKRDVIKELPITTMDIDLISISAYPELLHSIKVTTLPFYPPKGVTINEEEQYN